MSDKSIAVFLFFSFTTVGIILGQIIPITLDESYYLFWTKHLDFGYFDHPPIVSLVGMFSRFGPNVLYGLSSVFLFFAARHFFDRKISLIVVSLCLLSPGGMANSFLLTPDSPLMFLWILAFYYFISVVKLGQVKKFVVVGMVCGFGLLTKYTFILFPLCIFLVALLYHRAWFRSVFLYAGGAVCLLLFSCNLIWNAQNNWITFHFQMKHGLDQARPQIPNSAYPDIREPSSGTFEELVTKNLVNFERAAAPALHEKVEVGTFARMIYRVIEYLGGLVLLFGFPSFVALYGLYGLMKGFRYHRLSSLPSIKIFALTPIVFFGVFALFSKVEANWAGMYLVGASVFCGMLLQDYKKHFQYAIAVNVILCIPIAVTSLFANSPYIRKRNRLVDETFGFYELANQLTDREPILTDRYQLASIISYHLPQATVGQFPGINRDSQWTLMNLPFDRFLDERRSFQLITSESVAYKISSFHLISAERIRICDNGKIIVFQYFENPQNVCMDYIRQWLRLRYARQ